MKRGSRKAIAIGAVAVALTRLLVSAPAAAHEGMAEQLFVEGRKLMAEEKYELACAKFKAAHDLDRTATGTLLNLALCHERIHKTASAWAELRQVAAESAGRREDRVALAREHEARLAPLLSHLTIVVPAASRAPGLKIVLDDGNPVAEASWGTELPVDPGPHVIRASAPARLPLEVRVTIGDAADRKAITIPILAVEPVAPRDLGADDVARERAAARAQTRRIIGYSVGAAGLATLAVGVAFGLSASAENDRAKSLCDASGVCPDSATKDEASRTLASADKSATVANVLAIAGGALIVGGAVLVFTALPTRSAPPLALRVTPMWGGAGLVLGGAL